MDEVKLLSHNKYEKSANNFAVRKLLKQQEEEIANRSKVVEEYITRLKSLVTLTKESSNLFSEVAGNILNLLPGDWGTTIKRVFLILAFIIALLIVFFLLLLTCNVSN